MLGATADGRYVLQYCTETVTAYLKFMKSFAFLVFFFSPSRSENTDEKSGNKIVGVVDKTENLFLDSF